MVVILTGVYVKMKKHFTVIFLFFAVFTFVSACSRVVDDGVISTAAKAETQTLSTMPTPIVMTTQTKNFIEMPVDAPTISPTPEIAFTPEPDSIILSYTYHSDGGDDLLLCLLGDGRPSIVLYGDGSFIRLQEGQYWQSYLTDEEITTLLDELAATGLFRHTEGEYREGGNVFIVKGKSYIAPSNLPETDPLSRAMRILFKYKPQDRVKYVPDELLLGIYRITDMEGVEGFFPQSVPVVNDWESDPLSAYGEVWKVVRDEELLKVMAQFDSFPAFKLLRDGDTYYIASICAK